MAFDTKPYELMKSSKVNELDKKKKTTLDSLATQETQTNNTYADLMATMQKRKADLEAQKQAKLQGFDTQATAGQQSFNNQRDQAVVGVTNRARQVQDWLARNNLITSNENADQMGRLNTDMSNQLGNINTDKNTFNTGLTNDRNAYDLQYQGNMGDVSNSVSAADRDKAMQIANILTQRQNTESQYAGDLQALNDEVEAQKLQDLQSYNNARAKSSGGSGPDKKPTKTVLKQQAWDAYNETMQTYGTGYINSWLNQNKSSIVKNLGESEYYKMVGDARAAVTNLAQQQSRGGQNGYIDSNWIKEQIKSSSYR